ncbi:hypothetical protein [Winogradskyella sp.]|uniref:hypothetical protein n=1 Tax=Winogradskyella sp. TaxID=1883156 RepID=UPI003512DD44
MITRLKRNDKIGLFFFVAFIISTSLIWLFEERFDKEQWRSNPQQRYKMADDLIESQLLIGKTKEEVISILGYSSNTIESSQEILTYSLGKQPSFFETKKEYLLIIFIDGRVKEVTLAVE